MTSEPIPATLLEDIEAGRCVAFVGAGFSAAAHLPTWPELVSGIAAVPGLDREVVEHVRRVLTAKAKPSAHELDQMAQLLEDSLGREDFVAQLAARLRGHPEASAMRQRLEWLRDIPFRAIVTTNFDTLLDGMLPGPESYRALLRPTEFRWWERAFWGDERVGAPVLKLHGDLSREDAAQTVVITRRDYRRQLYGDPGYMTFLRGLLSTNTVLFMGFSFEDAYLNELRSQVLALFDYRGRGGQASQARPLAYAILHDVPDLVKLHFERHEGIDVLNFDSHEPPGFGGFDAYLGAIWQATALLPRFGRLLAGRRLLWVDAHPHNNDAGYRFLTRATLAYEAGRAPVLALAPGVPEALALLATAEEARPFDLVITHWGEGDARGDAGERLPNAIRLLECMRRHDRRAPVVVFSGPVDVETRRQRVLALGAQAYCFHWEGLFRKLDELLRPALEAP